MADTLTPQARSANMARIRGKNTQIEIAVRKLLFKLGYRYRLYDKNLPGSPDIVFKTRKKVIFVHGCFWHRHPGCKLAYVPKTREQFWTSKFEANEKRDRDAVRSLIGLGWEVAIVWQCEIANLPALAARLDRFLAAPVP